MITFAFRKPPESDLWGQGICRASNSIYCHVEAWLDGPMTAARCFSSREPVGASFQVRDLSDTREWEMVTLNLTPTQEDRCIGFAYGACGKRYNALGLLGYATGTGMTFPWDLFCSQCCADMLRCCGFGSAWKPSNMISPGDLAGYLKELEP